MFTILILAFLSHHSSASIPSTLHKQQSYFKLLKHILNVHHSFINILISLFFRKASLSPEALSAFFRQHYFTKRFSSIGYVIGILSLFVSLCVIGVYGVICIYVFVYIILSLGNFSQCSWVKFYTKIFIGSIGSIIQI